MSTPRPTELTVASPVGSLPGVGAARARALASAGVVSVGDLLLHLPLRWVEHPPALALAEAQLEPGPLAVIARLEDLQLRRLGRGKSLVSGRLVDGRRSLKVVWFNQPWRADAGPGPWLARGELQSNNFGLQLMSPELLRGADAPPGAAATAIYPALAGLPAAIVVKLIRAALDLVATVEDPLPPELLASRELPALAQALAALHRGPRAEAAFERLVWGELLEQQLLVLARRARRRDRGKGHRYRVDDTTREAARAVLPFALTAAQKRALGEIVADLQQPGPMARLLHGDVGSGKTLVAALAMFVAAESGLQAALLAPTEVLAEQHAASLTRLFAGRHEVALVTAERDDPAVRRALAAGRIPLAVGTHALLRDDLTFRSLALVVVDEQHRFGVNQRATLYHKGQRPDLLLLSATPIPRSLALSDFGDLDLSVLDELPPGRAGIETALLSSARRPALERRLREVLAAGERVFVVLPRIDSTPEASELDLDGAAPTGSQIPDPGFPPLLAGAPSLEVEGARWRDALGPERTALAHGRLGTGQLRAALEDFRAGRVQALVATSVIEVGLDVPEATWMVIDGAEFFGLAQLHQLRGRVGRGPLPGRCVGLHGSLSETAQQRLEAFAATNDGFALSDADLALRGPGDFLGRRQAGSSRFRFANPLRDHGHLERARADAAQLLEGEEAARFLTLARAGALVRPGVVGPD